MNRTPCLYKVVLLALLAFGLAPAQSNGQSASAPFRFQSGQTLYIVAFRRADVPVSVDPATGAITRSDYFDLDLDVERKVRKQIEKWHYFRVADKPSGADFVYLVNLDNSSIEALAIPFEAYRQHFREKFDLDALRDAAYGRYMAGPLKLPTVTRLTDRLVKQFREKVTAGAVR